MDIQTLKLSNNTQRILIIKNAEITPVVLNEQTLNKLKFTAEDPETHVSFELSDVLVRSKKGIKKQGLWISTQNNEISQHSTIGKLLAFYGYSQITDFINKSVEVLPDNNNFLLIKLFKDIDESGRF